MNKYNRVTIVCGHYGVGKTTFSINYSMYIRNNTSKDIYIADLDVVNPYFRSREHSSYLEQKNIKAGFLHVPYAQGQREGVPCLAMDTIVLALELALSNMF